MAIKFLNTVQVDTDVLYVDAANDRVGIGLENPSTTLHVGGFTRMNGGLQMNTASATIYQIQNSALRFGTNNTERMRITNTGQVGIVTTSPGYLLDVEGSTNNADIGIRINNTFDDNDPASEPNTVLFLNAASNNGYLRVHGAPANTAAKHQIDLGSTAGSSFLTFSPGGAEKMRIATDGKVGIGTTIPATKLMLEHNNDGAVGGTIRIKDRDSQQSANQLTGAIEFESQDATTPTSGVSTAIKAFAASSTGGSYLTISTTDVSTSTLDERMRIDSSGNVGIGTPSPAWKLHLNNSAELTPTYQKFTNGTATTGTTLGIDSDGDFIINNGEAKEIKFYTND